MINIRLFSEKIKEKENKLLKNEESIKNILMAIKSNPKFIGLINNSLNSIEKLISTNNLDIYYNIYKFIELDGISILTNIIHKNSDKELMTKAINILSRFIIYKAGSNIELYKLFVQHSGHSIILPFLVYIKDEHIIKIILLIIYKLVEKEEILNIVIDSNLIGCIQFLNDSDEIKLEIKNMLFKILAKTTSI